MKHFQLLYCTKIAFHLGDGEMLVGKKEMKETHWCCPRLSKEMVERKALADILPFIDFDSGKNDGESILAILTIDAEEKYLYILALNYLIF